MRLPRFGLGPLTPEPAILDRFAREVSRVFEALTGPQGVLAGRLTDEHFQARRLPLMLDSTMALPLRVPLPVPLVGTPWRLEVADAEEPDGTHKGGVAVTWAIHGTRELELRAVTGLTPGIKTLVTLLIWSE